MDTREEIQSGGFGKRVGLDKVRQKWDYEFEEGDHKTSGALARERKLWSKSIPKPIGNVKFEENSSKHPSNELLL